MVEQLYTVDELRRRLDIHRGAGRRVGLVPTMGALHDGHASLIAAAAARCDVVLTTIFVNPLQFAPTDDLDSYPRDLGGDLALAAASGASMTFTPSVAEMYPFGPLGVLTNVSVAGITDVLDGLARSGHFDGVATVVAKLFAIAGPCVAFFGEKDWQQLVVVRRMAVDLSFPVEIVGCPTVREPGGLAMSSRNRYLSPSDRAEASVIWRALQAGVDVVAAASLGPHLTGSGPNSTGSGPNSTGSGPNLTGSGPNSTVKTPKLAKSAELGAGSVELGAGRVGLGGERAVEHRFAGRHGVLTPADVSATMLAVLESSPVVQSVDYVACVDPLTLQTPAVVDSDVRLLIAARVGRGSSTARLIDNCAAPVRRR